MPPLICSFSCLFGGTIPPFSPSYFNTLLHFQTSVCPYGCLFASPVVCAYMGVVLFLIFLPSSPQWNPLQHLPSSALKMFSQNKGDKHSRKRSRKLDFLQRKRIWCQSYRTQDSTIWLEYNHINCHGWITSVFVYTYVAMFLCERIRYISNRYT